MGRVQAICISAEKGVVKERVDSATFQPEHGIVGDAHAGPWHRQVSLLPGESIEQVRAMIPDLADGAFAENVVIAGLDFTRLVVGASVRLGREIELEVTQVGKECHRGCAIREITGDCIMPREGVFCRVVTGGELRPGDAAELLAAGVGRG